MIYQEDDHILTYSIVLIDGLFPQCHCDGSLYQRVSGLEKAMVISLSGVSLLHYWWMHCGIVGSNHWLYAWNFLLFSEATISTPESVIEIHSWNVRYLLELLRLYSPL